MKKENIEVGEDERRPEHDLSEIPGSVRRKCAERYKAGPNLVHLAPDVAAVFRDEGRLWARRPAHPGAAHA